MTTPRSPENVETLFVTDGELARRLGVPRDLGLRNIKIFDDDPTSGFPPKIPMLGNLRYWPAVKAWFYAREMGAARDDEPEDDQYPADLIGAVYFLASATHVKIGFSAVSVKKRIRTIRQNHYEKLELLTVIPNAPRKLEKNLHKKFEAFHAKGEWFTRSPEIEEFVRNIGLGHWRKELLP